MSQNQIMNEKTKAKLLLGGKFIFISFLLLILLIPLSMIKDIINERQSLKQGVMNEVAGTWGFEQNVGAIILTVPYEVFWQEKEEYYVGNNLQSRLVQKKSMHYKHFLPEEIKIKANVEVEERKRSIYKVPLYTSDIFIEGYFPQISEEDFLGKEKKVLWHDAFINLGISDLNGIRESINVNWNNQNLAFIPSENKNLFPSSVEAKLKDKIEGNTQYHFSTSLRLAGSFSINFFPLGKITEVKMKSNWSHPSFKGADLPQNHEITDQGFQANWKKLYLARNFPQNWVDQEIEFNKVRQSSFGVELFQPVGIYHKATRACKYGILFILLTFLFFFLIEIMNENKVHPFQYLLVGLGLALFYILVISLSEHISFGSAYLISAIANISLIVLFAKKIFSKGKAVLILLGSLSSLYIFLYVLLQLIDYALVIGSWGLFLILALVMYASTRINWQRLGQKD